MKRVLAVLAMAGVLCFASAAQAGVSLKKYDCDTSKGFSSFVKDYVATNGVAIVNLAVSVIPSFSFSDDNAVADVSESTIGLKDVKGVVELFRTKTSVGASPLGFVNTALHLVCVELELSE